jgi:hypothetical protein
MSPEEKDQKIERLEQEVKALLERIAELERSLGLDRGLPENKIYSQLK